jgi:hypothetical protein
MRVAVCTELEDLLSNAEVEASCMLANHGFPSDYSDGCGEYSLIGVPASWGRVCGIAVGAKSQASALETFTHVRSQKELGDSIGNRTCLP